MMRQAMGVLDLVKQATVSVQGGPGGLLAQATFDMMEVRQLIETEEQDIYPKVCRCLSARGVLCLLTRRNTSDLDALIAGSLSYSCSFLLHSCITGTKFFLHNLCSYLL